MNEKIFALLYSTFLVRYSLFPFDSGLSRLGNMLPNLGFFHNAKGIKHYHLRNSHAEVGNLHPKKGNSRYQKGFFDAEKGNKHYHLGNTRHQKGFFDAEKGNTLIQQPKQLINAIFCVSIKKQTSPLHFHFKSKSN